MSLPPRRHFPLNRRVAALLRRRPKLSLGRLAQERGQSMVIMVTAMLITLGMGALSIDIASWYQQRHQDQVAADAAALAAANCMANEGITLPGNLSQECVTTLDATNVALDYAAENGVTIPASDVSFSGDTVTVTTPTSSPAYLAQVFGMGGASESAQAAASWNGGSGTSTSTDSGGGSQTSSISFTNVCDSDQAESGACLFAYANDSNCPDLGVTLANVGTETVTGGIWSNSSLETVNADVNSSWGDVWYGDGNLCSWVGASLSNGPVFAAGPTAEPAYSGWPRDFTSLMSCGPDDAYQCTGPDGTPSYCTQAAPAFGLDLGGEVTALASGALAEPASDGQVYCAYGTSTDMADPDTWNGVIDMSADSLGTTSASFVGGLVVLTSLGTGTLGAELDTSLGHLLVYANDALPVVQGATPAADVATVGNASLTGDIFAPNGAITATAVGNGLFKTFLEGSQVVVDAEGDMVGEGPVYSTTTTGTTTTSTTTTSTTSTTATTAGTDQLVQ